MEIEAEIEEKTEMELHRGCKGRCAELRGAAALDETLLK